MKSAMNEIAEKILVIQGEGDYTSAKKWIEEEIRESTSDNVLLDEFKSMIPKDLKGTQIIEPVIMEEFSNIGTNSILLPGSILRRGVLLTAGSLLMGDTEEWGVYKGNPAILVKKIDGGDVNVSCIVLESRIFISFGEKYIYWSFLSCARNNIEYSNNKLLIWICFNIFSIRSAIEFRFLIIE